MSPYLDWLDQHGLPRRRRFAVEAMNIGIPPTQSNRLHGLWKSDHDEWRDAPKPVF